MSKKAKRAYKYRFSPTNEQKRILAQTFGCVRFVYNWGLRTRKIASFQQGQSLSYNDLAAMLPDLKRESPWLADVSSLCLQQALPRLWTYVNGSVQNVAPVTIVTRTPLKTFWPRGSRSLPVEEV